MNTEKALFTKDKTVYKITHMCDTVAGKVWEKGSVAGIYRNCFNILTEDGYMVTVFKRVICYSTRALISDIRCDMSKLPIRNGDRVLKNEYGITIGDIVFTTDRADIIEVKREPVHSCPGPAENIECFRDVLSKHAKDRPVIYDRYLKQKAKNGFDVLKTSPGEGFGMLIGLGIGLTPSCDDIIAGMSAYFYLLGIGDRFNTELSRYLKENGDSATSCVSKNLLEDVAAGCINPTLYNLVKSIICEKENIEKYTLELMNYGSTSGTETCMGILYAHELLCGKEKIQWL